MPTAKCQRFLRGMALAGAESYPKRILVSTKRLIDAYNTRSADGYLSRCLVQGNGLEWFLIVVVVNCLEKEFGIAQDGEGVAGNVGLGGTVRVSVDVQFDLSFQQRKSAGLTVMRRESQNPDARAWRRDSGLPGRITFILPAADLVSC